MLHSESNEDEEFEDETTAPRHGSESQLHSSDDSVVASEAKHPAKSKGRGYVVYEDRQEISVFDIHGTVSPSDVLTKHSY